MLIWIFIIIILLAIIFAILLYNYDNSQFKKITAYSFSQVMLNRKIHAIYKLSKKITSANEKGKLLLNVQLPKTDAVIDAIYIQPSGIYVLKWKDLNGWLYGQEKASEWTVAMYKEKTVNFPNPVLQCTLNTRNLQKAVNIDDPKFFHPTVVFSDNTVFKQVAIQSKSVKVINARDIKGFLKRHKEEMLSDTDIEQLYLTLETYTSAVKKA